MTKSKLKALLDYLDARMDERIAQAFRRDAMSEGIRADEFRQELENAFGIERFGLSD